MAALVLTLTSPDGVYVETGGVISLSLPPAESFNAQVLTATFTSNWNQNGDESLATNPTRLNSMATVDYNGTRAFKGRVRDISRTRNADGTSTVSITALSRLADLTGALAGTANGGTRFLERTPTATLTEKTLYPGVAEDDCEAPYFPAFGADTWAYNADSLPVAVLDVNTVVGASSLRTSSTTDQAFPPRGYLCIAAGQVVYYDGYHPNPAAGGKYTFYNLTWGLFGTSGGADPVTAGTELYFTKPFAINLQSAPILYGEYDATPLWEEIASGWYTVRASEGRFDFKGDPTAAPFSYLAIRATYDVIDEDHASRVLAGGVAADVLEYTGDGGAALSASDYSISIDDIPIAEARATTTSSALATIQGLMADVAASPYNSAYKIVFQYFASDDTFRLFKLAQKGTPDVILAAAISIDETVSLDGYYTGITAQYNRVAPSLISPTRMWHAAIGAAICSGGPNVSALYYQFQDREMAQGWQIDDGVAGNNAYTYYLMDGNDSTGWGIGAATTSGAEDVNLVYCYFRSVGGSRTHTVERVRVVLDLRRSMLSPITVRVLGLTTYSPGTPPTASGYVKLSDHLIMTFGAQKAGTMQAGLRGAVDRRASRMLDGQRIPWSPPAGKGRWQL